MQESNTDHVSGRLPERTAAIACRRAGVALRGSREQAASDLLDLALDLAVGSRDFDALTDEWVLELLRLQRNRRRGLTRALRAA